MLVDVGLLSDVSRAIGISVSVLSRSPVVLSVDSVLNTVVMARSKAGQCTVL